MIITLYIQISHTVIIQTSEEFTENEQNMYQQFMDYSNQMCY